MKSIVEADIKPNTKALVRCDLDVPIEGGLVRGQYRLGANLLTLQHIIQKGGRPIVCGHMGEPHGKYADALSTKHLLSYFTEKLGNDAFELLENLRFDIREEENDPGFARELVAKTGATLYVNESFATSHRKHASLIQLPKLLPAYAGIHLRKEVATLSKLLTSPKHPFVVIIGGTKIESKKPVISKFLQIADFVLLGGKLAQEWQDAVPSNLLLARDSVDGSDIGPQTISAYTRIIATAQTILWAGPLGVYENERYMTGTAAIARAVAEATQKNGATSIVGGGDTVTACQKIGVLEKLSFVSVGGGAMLKFLAEGTLPGLEALKGTDTQVMKR